MAVRTVFVDEKTLDEQYRRDFEASCLAFAHAGDFNDDAHDIIEGRVNGTPLYLAPQMAFAQGAVTMWGGESGVGKSMLTGQVAQWLVRQGQKVVVISIEMTPGRTLTRMFRQVKGLPYVPEDVDIYDEWSASVDDLLVLLKPGGRIDSKSIIAACSWICEKEEREYGIRVDHIIVDNLMTVVEGDDDWNSQKFLICGLEQVAQERKVHIHVVHHIRKPESSGAPRQVRKHDLKGTTAITDRADNVLLLMFNPAYIEAVENYRAVHGGAEMPSVEKAKIADRLLKIAKSRDGAGVDTPPVPLWFDRSSLCFCTDMNLTRQVLCPQDFAPKIEAYVKAQKARHAS